MNSESDDEGQLPIGPLRKIRSYVVRSSRMTEAQQQAYDRHLQQWSITAIDQVEVGTLFGNTNPVVVEIGFGMGDSLIEMASAMRDHNFIGIEVHQPGIGRLLNLVDKKELTNVRVMHGDAVALLEQKFPKGSIARINIFFPDPWHKTRHHKRRLIQPDFANLLASKIKANGLLHLATDWEPYAKHMLNVLEENELLENIAGSSCFSDAASLGRPETKFERRGRKLGHGVWDLAYRRA